MKTLMLILSLVSMNVYAAPSMYCNPQRSKPCGNGCIALSKTCRKPWTTAVSGVNPSKSGKKGYDKPKFLEKAPENE